MKSRVVRSLIFVCTILTLPAVGYAQEAVLSGLVTDTTGGVLPGVTVTAQHEATGNTFEAVTDARGSYRMPVRIGVYKITTELQGFNTATRTGVELLVGQTIAINLQMSPAGVAESVIVTGQSPLVDTSGGRALPLFGLWPTREYTRVKRCQPAKPCKPRWKTRSPTADLSRWITGARREASTTTHRIGGMNAVAVTPSGNIRSCTRAAAGFS